MLVLLTSINSERDTAVRPRASRACISRSPTNPGVPIIQHFPQHSFSRRAIGFSFEVWLGLQQPEAQQQRQERSHRLVISLAHSSCIDTVWSRPQGWLCEGSN